MTPRRQLREIIRILNRPACLQLRQLMARRHPRRTIRNASGRQLRIPRLHAPQLDERAQERPPHARQAGRAGAALWVARQGEHGGADDEERGLACGAEAWGGIVAVGDVAPDVGAAFAVEVLAEELDGIQVGVCLGCVWSEGYVYGFEDVGGGGGVIAAEEVGGWVGVWFRERGDGAVGEGEGVADGC